MSVQRKSDMVRFALVTGACLGVRMTTATFDEVWLPIPGYSHLEASSQGRIRTIERTIDVAASRYRPAYRKTVRVRVLSQWTHKGRCTVATDKESCVNVGRLVCLAFHGLPPEGKPNALHRDDNSWNNMPDNLYWGDQVQNARDADLSTRRRGEKNPRSKLTDAQTWEIWERRLAGESLQSIAIAFGISVQRVTDIAKGRSVVIQKGWRNR
jgi:NUMOD4 motif